MKIVLNVLLYYVPNRYFIVYSKSTQINYIAQSVHMQGKEREKKREKQDKKTET